MISIAENYLLLFSVPIYFLVILFEITLSNWQMKRLYSFRETLMNFYFTLVNAGVDLLFRSVYLAVMLFIFKHGIVEWESKGIAYWLILFLLEDLAFYFEHRVDHHCRIFWAVHVTHHSSPEFNLTTGFRSSVFQPLYRFVYFLPIAMLGFEPMDVLFMFSLTQIYGILLHTQYIAKLPSWFEAVFVSPSHHRVHHASNVVYLDRNMGMCLIIWDKLFGTFQAELGEEPVRYGLTKMPGHLFHPVKSITHEFSSLKLDLSRSADWKTRLSYLFYPPGWSHDGSSLTARQMKDQLKRDSLSLHDYNDNVNALPHISPSFLKAACSTYESSDHI